MMDKGAEEAKVGQLAGYVGDLADYSTTIDNNAKRLPEIFQGDVASDCIEGLTNLTNDIGDSVDSLPGQVNGLYGIIEQVWNEEHPPTSSQGDSEGDGDGNESGNGGTNQVPDFPIERIIHIAGRES